MSDDRDVAEVLALLDDEYARAILRQTSGEALSASEISDACGMSVSTVYRRADRLVDCGLLVERTVATPDGNHYSTYESRVEELTVSISTDSVDVRVTERPVGDLGDRFTDLWEGL
ncbi:helix-turn-helix domain-containing protein [Halapricum sp. CBA1109]|uniref:helix-turn-helix domain-containing protein n=1 Tax=Halapricum sp. CBA1109 TaxID=2668068 RepID=UPI0013B6FF98|nr:helix-turn-helix domain-containing protein [Halapricum sp. CBA1109]